MTPTDKFDQKDADTEAKGKVGEKGAGSAQIVAVVISAHHVD